MVEIPNDIVGVIRTAIFYRILVHVQAATVGFMGLFSRLAIILVAVVLNYAWDLYTYRAGRRNVGLTDCKTPPRYPTFLPGVGHLLSFLWDTAAFFQKAL
jgi:hypothetical protein